MPGHPSPLDNGHSNGEALDALLKDMEKEGELAGQTRNQRQGETAGPRKISPWIIIPIWMALSTAVIILNKHIFTKLHFPFPIFLTGLHMAVAACGTQILRYTTSLLDQLKTKPVTSTQYIRTILPLGIAFSASLSLSNLAYLHLSVSFVQILKAFIPVVVHVMSCFVGLAETNTTIASILLTVTGGCAIAAFGEIQFELFGFICQILAVLIESSRLVMTHLLLGGQTYSPLSLVYLYAPLCFALMLFLQPVFEGWSAAWAQFGNVGLPTFLLSGGLAFALNIAGVYLIESAGSTVLCLSGIVKDICLVTFSVLIFSSSITPVQIVGYGIALVGLFAFKQMNTSSKGGKSQSPVLNSAALAKYGYPLLVTALVAALIGSILRPWEAAATAAAHSNWSDTPGRQVYSPASVPTHERFDSVLESGSTYKHHMVHGSAAEVMPDYQPLPDPKTLPRMAWVIVISPDNVPQYASVLEHISCYCARAGINFIVDYRPDWAADHFFISRYWNVAKYLKFYQWLMVTDADVLVADSERDPRDLLDLADADGVDIVLADRDQGEVCSCAYLVKNSPGGFAFLKRLVGWREGLGDLRDTNYDNGNLMEVLLAGTRPGLPNNDDGTARASHPALATAGPCEDIFATSYADYVNCHWRYFYQQRTEHPTSPWWDSTLFRWAPAVTPIQVRVYKMYAGFIREHPMVHGKFDSDHPKGFMPGDFLYHSTKDGKTIDTDMALCTGRDWQFKPSIGEDELRKYMHEHFAWAWPGCWDAKGTYVCDEQEGPRDHSAHKPLR